MGRLDGKVAIVTAAVKGGAEDVAHAVVCLASDDSRFISSQTLYNTLTVTPAVAPL